MNPHQAIFDRLRTHAPAIARTSAAQRLAKIRRLYQGAYDLRAEIGAAGREELGMDGRAQMAPLKWVMTDVMSNLETWMQDREAPPQTALMGRRGYIHNEPKGVVLHLATWNAPILVSLSPLISMMAAGNAIVLKPSEIAPLSADLVGKIIAKAGLEDDVAVITGGPETAQALLKLPFNHICYVGNNRIGRLVMQAAAEHFAGVTLEMGGKNPVVIAADADLDSAAAKIVYGRHMIAGQTCLAPDYIFVDEKVKQAFADKLVAKIKAFYDPADKGFQASPDLPRIVHPRHVTRIKGLIDDAVAKGARLLIGGEALEEARFISPTVLDGLTEDMAIFQEEVFGPVLTLQGFTSRDFVVAEIEKRPKPLGFYVFTQSRETADWFINATRAGTSAVNGIATQSLVPSLPFGGFNHSGIGSLNGETGFKEFSNLRSVVEDSLDPTQGSPMFYPPYPPGMEGVLDQMLTPDPAWG
jgi:aldehyde dehydrogenase (NAD+)